MTMGTLRRNAPLLASVLLVLGGVLLHAAPLQAREAAPLAADEVIEARMVAISEELRCLVCQNESIAASRADLAVDLRRQIREMIHDGRSDEEILDFMVDRYGDFVRFRPPLKNTTLLLWSGPFILLVAGLGGLLLHLRRRATRLAAAEALSAAQREQARALLEADDGETGTR